MAGTDCTGEYDPIHPPGTLDQLPPGCLIGTIDESTLPLHPGNNQSSGNHVPEQAKQQSQNEPPSSSELAQRNSLPVTIPLSLSQCLNLNDVESLSTSRISNKAWAYYVSAADDLVSKSYNNVVYSRILLRPRVFIDCTICSLATTLFSRSLTPIKLDLPIFVSPAAQARLAHPDGEAAIARACTTFGALQIISNNASLTPEQIVAAAPDGIFAFQLYIQEKRSTSSRILARIAKIPQIKFICLTLDAPVPGKREHDERRGLPSSSTTPGDGKPTHTAPVAAVNLTLDPAARAAGTEGGVGKALFAGTATDLTWATTLPWLLEHTKLPLVLKGIQTHEDALLATEHPQVAGILLSNHGGRALDTAPPAVHTLLEIRRHCPQVFERLDVLVDGGIKRGTDVVKALALGAKGVGIGRAALYGLGAGGQEGLEKTFSILKGEVETCIRLLGVEEVRDLGMRHVNTRRVEQEIYHEPESDPGVKARL